MARDEVPSASGDIAGAGVFLVEFSLAARPASTSKSPFVPPAEGVLFDVSGAADADADAGLKASIGEGASSSDSFSTAFWRK